MYWRPLHLWLKRLDRFQSVWKLRSPGNNERNVAIVIFSFHYEIIQICFISSIAGWALTHHLSLWMSTAERDSHHRLPSTLFNSTSHSIILSGNAEECKLSKSGFLSAKYLELLTGGITRLQNVSCTSGQQSHVSTCFLYKYLHIYPWMFPKMVSPKW